MHHCEAQGKEAGGCFLIDSGRVLKGVNYGPSKSISVLFFLGISTHTAYPRSRVAAGDMLLSDVVLPSEFILTFHTLRHAASRSHPGLVALARMGAGSRRTEGSAGPAPSKPCITRK